MQMMAVEEEGGSRLEKNPSWLSHLVTQCRTAPLKFGRWKDGLGIEENTPFPSPAVWGELAEHQQVSIRL